MSGGRRVGQAALAVVLLGALLLAAAATPGAVGVDRPDSTEVTPRDRPDDSPGDDPGDRPGERPGDRPTDRPGDRLEPGPGTADRPTDRPGDRDGDVTRRAPPPYRIAVVPDPAPGRTVTVVVSRGGRPVAGARVAFNGRAIGRTNAAGRVRGEVPYETELVVRVRPPRAPTG